MRKCMPADWGRYISASYYSPAICPSGLISAGAAPSNYGPPIESSETAIICCQPGFTFTTIDGATSNLGQRTGPFTHWCHDPASAHWNYAIQVRWASSDLSILETDPLTPGKRPVQPAASPSETTTCETVSASLGVKTPVPQLRARDLPTSAKVGIAIGTLVSSVFLAVVLFLLIRHRRSRARGIPFVLRDITPNEFRRGPSDPVLAVSETFNLSPPAAIRTAKSRHAMARDDTGELEEQYRLVHERRRRLLEIDRLAHREERLRRELTARGREQRQLHEGGLHELPDW